MAYCIATEVQDAGTQLGNYPDWFLDDCIERASRYFDNLCGVEPGFFESADATATARTFYGDGTNFLKLDAYVAGSLNATISVPEGYEAPAYIARDGYLVLTTNEGSLLHQWPPFPSWWRIGAGWWAGLPITVTARWGYTVTPADVKMAVIEMVINLLRTVDPAETNLTDLEGQPLRERVPPRVAEVARHYRARGAVLV